MPLWRTLNYLPARCTDAVPKKQAEAVLGDLMTLPARHLKKGNKIRLTGLGILQVRKRAARMGRNQATGANHQNEGQQEGRIPACQGTEGSGVAR
jgi:nucleoid DNA-binding protein